MLSTAVRSSRIHLPKTQPGHRLLWLARTRAAWIILRHNTAHRQRACFHLSLSRTLSSTSRVLFAVTLWPLPWYCHVDTSTVVAASLIGWVIGPPVPIARYVITDIKKAVLQGMPHGLGYAGNLSVLVGRPFRL